jgi:diguanylate cyclase (GGDEF)-like protein/PAS domain S-box-containing protein
MNTEDHRSAFWSFHLRVGNGILAVESAVVMLYLIMTPGGGHRSLLLILAASSIVAGLVPLVLSAHIATRSWRVRFSLTWTVLSGVVLALFVRLDGGMDSPLLGLMVLPIMYAALAMRPSHVAACGLAGVAELLWVELADPNILPPRANLMMYCAIIGGVAVLALASSINRARLEARDAALMLEQVRLADTDGLTGCLNHRAFMARLNAEVDRAVRHRFEVSLLIADVDLLKVFNDTHGHQEGDAALQAVGAILKSATRSIDVSGRVGGDEFAVLLPHTPLGDAKVVAMRITRGLRDRPGAKVTVSIGAASLDPASPTSKQLFRDADAAMYRAKANGRGGVATSSRVVDVPTQAADTKRLEDRLRLSNRETAEAMKILETLESVAPVGFGFVDREFRIVRLNAMFAAINGRPIADQIGRTVAEVVPAMWPEIERVFRHVLDSGEAVENIEVHGETADDPGRVHHWRASYNPVSLDGEVVGIGIVAIDITEQTEWEHSRLTVV